MVVNALTLRAGSLSSYYNYNFALTDSCLIFLLLANIVIQSQSITVNTPLKTTQSALIFVLKIVQNVFNLLYAIPRNI